MCKYMLYSPIFFFFFFSLALNITLTDLNATSLAITTTSSPQQPSEDTLRRHFVILMVM